MKYILSLIVIAIIVVAGWYVVSSTFMDGVLLSEQSEQNKEDDERGPTQEQLIQEARANLPEVVATVNGTEITKDEFLFAGERVAGSLIAQGIDVSNPQVQANIGQNALLTLISESLLTELAKDTEFSQSEANEQYETIVEAAGGVDELAQQAEAAGITIEQIKDDINRDFQVRTFLEAELSLDKITVTDAEIKEFFETNLLAASSTITLDEYSEGIETQLRAGKEQEQINQYLEKLQEEADVEIFL